MHKHRYLPEPKDRKQVDNIKYYDYVFKRSQGKISRYVYAWFTAMNTHHTYPPISVLGVVKDTRSKILLNLTYFFTKNSTRHSILYIFIDYLESNSHDFTKFRLLKN